MLPLQLKRKFLKLASIKKIKIFLLRLHLFNNLLNEIFIFVT